MAETLVLCGGARGPPHRGKAIQLANAGDRANVALQSQDIGRRMLASVSGAVADLLDVATYVYCTDQLVSRGGKTGRNLCGEWRRELRFIIPVREPDRWNAPEVSGGLERLLAFMSDDSMRFEFVGMPTTPASTDYLDFASDSDEVALFSGGLDSLTGVIDRLGRGPGRLLLISHQSSTKIANRQRYLARQLGERFPNRVVHVPIRVNMHGVEGHETTQRTRSFLFGALAAAVAQLSGTNRLSIFENGIVSLNLPVAGQVVGTAATRTTHPRVLRDMADFLSALCDRSIAVENGYLWKTKTEVASILRETGHADLARHTVSCSRVHWMTRLHTHCGSCSQCLDRRFGTLAADLVDHDPAEMYEVDVLTGARERDIDRTMAESFVRHALELGELGERGFMDRFGGEMARVVSCVPRMRAEQAGREMLELHRRHSAAVRSVLAEGFREHAHALAAQTLPLSCILRLVARPAVIPRPQIAAPEATKSNSADSRDFRQTSEIRIALDTRSRRVLIAGGPALEGPTAFNLVKHLADVAQQDRVTLRAPENHLLVSAAQLASLLAITEQALRRLIARIRERLAHDFEERAGLPMSAGALIENVRWKGYRLNPAVLIISPGELQPAQSRFVRKDVTFLA